MKKYTALIPLWLLCTIPSQAYLDPGTGSMMLSIIIALIATVIYSVKSSVFKIRYYLNKLLGKKIIKKKKMQIVFYNEGEQYSNTFYPILLELKNRNIDFHYLYSEKNDSTVKRIENIDAQYIGSGNKAFYYLNTLEADICIMTTPGLDVLQIRRSKGVKHYCHISHSAAGCAGYEVFGIDYFDSIITTNIYDKNFIIELEKIRKLPPKDIYVAGNPYLDVLGEKLRNIQTKKTKKTKKITILLAPTWGKTGLLSKYGKSLIGELAKNTKFHIIIRPHPQSIRYEKIIISQLESQFSDRKNIEWDYENDSLVSMSKADLMLSDFSGIIFDFIFLFSKPVISIPTSITLKGKDYIDIHTPLWQIDFFYKNTIVLAEENIDKISDIVIEGIEENRSRDKDIHEKYNPYSNYASKITVDAIESILNKLNGA
jgi:CDP-glycerol glycerophosphotransferase (TagB/SpsB family)